MRYFHRLAQNEPVMSLMNAVMRHPDLWNANRGEAEAIILRSDEGFDFEEMRAIPDAKRVGINLLKTLDGTLLGGISIIRLLPGAKLLPHVDAHTVLNRYHLVLNGLQGATFTCGDEAVHMLTGEVWWIDRRAEHSAKNNSADDCVHLLVDIRVEP